MADVRAMLRKERAARSGPPKPRKQAPAPPPSSKKRKAEDEQPDPRKRTKAEEAQNLPAGFFDKREAEDEDEVDEGDESAEDALPGFVPAKEKDPGVVASEKLKAEKPLDVVAAGNFKEKEHDGEVNEDEWAAFQEFAASIPEKSALDALKSNAALEAAPMTAEEMAIQARDEQGTQRGRREEEIEEEKEEAARNLEEEFEVMENLEDRVRRLREKRETLRRASKTSADGARPASTVVIQPEAVEEESEEDESDEADEFDGWRFGGA